MNHVKPVKFTLDADGGEFSRLQPGEAIAAEFLDTALTVTVSGAVGGHRLVFREAGGVLTYADSGFPEHADRQLWLTLNATGSGGGAVRLQNTGTVVEPSWNWDPGLPVFLDTDGAMTQTVPALLASGPVRLSWMIGRAVSPTELDLSFRDPITA